MKHKTIALEEGLGRFRPPLEAAGFSTVEIARFGGTDLNGADLVMVSGKNDELMGIQTTTTPVSVINVAGFTAQEIVDLARERLEQRKTEK